MAINKLILGDCLEVLKTIDNETVDLIYIDPPFFSNRTYEVIWGDKGEIRSFEDRFSGGIDHYIAWLKERVQEMHRILKPTGSIFVHCDWHANAHIRVHILDKIFGTNNFRSEIIWKRKGGSALAGMRELSTATDTIYYYTKSDTYIYNAVLVKDDDYVAEHFTRVDENGRKFMTTVMRSPNPRPNLQYDYKGYKTPPNGWAVSREKMEEMDRAGQLYFPDDKSKQIYKKLFLDEYRGAPINNMWDNVPALKGTSKEIIGYPTQKPIALLDRIIRMASNENDTVLDCFVGGGTTIVAADQLSRNWIGIDQSVQAIKVTEFRLNKQQGLFSKPFSVQLHKYDYDTLRYKDAFEFETWIVQQFGGLSNSKQRSDLGLDGRTRENQPIQVKRSDNIGRNVIDNFFSAVQRFDKVSFEKNKAEQKPIGFIIAFSFGKGAVQEVARLKNEENVIIKLVTVEEIVPIAKKPTLQVEIKDLGTSKNLREIEFVATGQSEAGIEFYAWDFAYNEQSFLPTVLLDKEGKQTYKFKAGEHRIAVKVVDNEGLESLEIVKLKINGVVERN
ncbi:site-specific DNA-methyltransferase [Thermoflexibacter ruber]|uniref:DNA methylase n=1 Tax=Thermoflexibacter ruber TaxID=1003 RepID=A0A1I2JYM7_9BACT|nr:site-specific DNA-methyltransferase [Thermoflexibacter ruber]SFF59010.1 DNA methylase [Thermoflexibacter ruber]